ncbi:hypothetical protein MY4824_002567 [Beauveria thailandica]
MVWWSSKTAKRTAHPQNGPGVVVLVLGTEHRLSTYVLLTGTTHLWERYAIDTTADGKKLLHREYHLLSIINGLEVAEKPFATCHWLLAPLGLASPMSRCHGAGDDVTANDSRLKHTLPSSLKVADWSECLPVARF